jgi:hypothetical protein
MSAHTPGPWLYEPADAGDESVGMQATPPYIFADPQGDGCVVPICTMDNPCRRADRPLADEYDEGIEWIGDYVANARLIAAAPEMLEALLAMQAFIEGEPDAVEPFGLIRAAIANATGGVA